MSSGRVNKGDKKGQREGRNKWEFEWVSEELSWVPKSVKQWVKSEVSLWKSTGACEGYVEGRRERKGGETLTWALIKTGATNHCAVANRALDPMLSSLCFFLLIFMTTHRGRSILTIIRKKMKLKEKKIFAQGYTESKRQNHKVNSDLSNAKKKKKKARLRKGKQGQRAHLGASWLCS